jgi:hypothetical protein
LDLGSFRKKENILIIHKQINFLKFKFFKLGIKNFFFSQNQISRQIVLAQFKFVLIFRYLGKYFI